MNSSDNLRVMVVIAHQDDFEYEAGGTCALLQKHYGKKFKLKILASTRGASGHHEMSTEDTYRRREKEALESASIIGAEYECLNMLDGSKVPGQFFLNRNTLGGLWNAIRDFEPDYIFCPPLPSDPLRGVHIDHYNTASAMRMIAYQLKVPNAYPTINFPVKRKLICPVIVNLGDSYITEGNYHVSVDISSSYEKKAAMLLCHKSQVLEWLPWTDGKTKNISEKEFLNGLRKRHISDNKLHGKSDDVPREYFCITQWGKAASLNDVKKIFPFGEITENIKKYII